jgi:hypothetical protein
MAAAFVDDVVSPELALVDPELASRARAALPLRGPTGRALAARAQQLSAVGRTSRRRRIAPVVAIASLAAVSIPGVGSLGGGPTADGSSAASAATESAAPSAAGAGSPVAASSSTVRSRTGSAKTQGVASPGSSSPVVRGLAQTQAQQVARQHSTGAASAPRAGKLVSRGALRPMTLVWVRVAGASSYDVELVRNGSRIYSASSSSPSVDVPRRWTHGGRRFSIQPEDQAYVWPVVDGRRAADPVVRGTMAFDNTLVARFTG